MENHLAWVRRGAQLSLSRVLARMDVRRVRSSPEAPSGGPHGVTRPPVSPLACHAPSLESQSLLGENQKALP